MLLIMGATVGEGRYSFGIALLVVVTAALLGDLLWYELGRFRGRSILTLLCKFSLEPDTCVRKTELGFMKRGAWSLLLVKFVPGMSLLSMPLAGAMKMPRWRFLLADAAGTSLWCTAYLSAGVLFRRQINDVVLRLGLFGRRAGLVLALLLAAYIAWRYWQRWRFRRQLRINRVSPEEALSMMNGEPPAFMVDLRNPKEIESSGLKIRGAQVLRPAEIRSHFQDLPRDREVILYCT
jgi:membrane protein DedA with SNARE-associated domain